MSVANDQHAWPKGASVLRRVMMGFRALQILQHEPDHPIQGPLFEWLMDSGAHGRVVKTMRRSDVGSRLLAERPTLQGPDLDLKKLEAMPEGSLGREFARYFERNGIQPFVTSFEIDSDDVYLAKRYRETHDLLHVITGYATHMLGEMELQAFVLGNLGFPSAGMILLFSLGLRFQVCGFRQLGAYVRRLAAAYRRGKRSMLMLDIDFERFWLEPVSRVASEWCAVAEPVPEITLGVYQPGKEPLPATT